MTREGSAPSEAVVLLHPLALSGAVWASWRAQLAPSWRVVTPDAPGHGGRRFDGAPWTIWDAAEEVHGALREQGLERAHLVGVSMGGCIALALASRHADWVASLALLDTTAWYGPSAASHWHARAERALSPREAQLSWQLERWFSPSFVAADDAPVRLVSSIFLGTSGPAHAAACQALGAFDAREEACRIETPTIVLTGEHDSATPPAMGEDLARRIAGSTFCLLSGLRHFGFLESPRPFAEVASHLDAARQQEPA